MKRVTCTLYSTGASDMPCNPNLVSSAFSFLNLLVVDPQLMAVSRNVHVDSTDTGCSDQCGWKDS